MAPKKPKGIPFAELPKQPKPKKYSTVNEATHRATQRRKIKGPQDEVFREAGPYKETKLSKAKGNPTQYFQGTSPVKPAVKLPKSTKKNPFFRNGGVV